MQASGARIKAFRARMAWIDFFNGVSTLKWTGSMVSWG